MEQPLISFIIPVHNGEKTLERAVESILSQLTAIDNIEILLIENGSTDGTVAIIETLVSTYHSVKSFTSLKGVSNARNKGIERACGKYIVFIDCDDYLPSEAVETYLRDAKIELATDLFFYNYEKGNSRAILIEKDTLLDNPKAIEDFRVTILKRPTNYMFSWAKMYLRSVLINYQIRFNPELRLAEDGDFLLRVTKYSQTIKLRSSSVYHYSIDVPSTIRGNDLDKVGDYVLAMVTSQKWVTENENIVIQEVFNNYILMHLNIIMVRDVFNGTGQGICKRIWLQKEVCHIPVYSSALNQLKIKELSNLALLPIWFLKNKLYYFSAIIYQLKVWYNRKKESNGDGNAQ